MSGAEPRVYAYGIIRLGDGGASPAPMEGLSGRPVRMVSRGGLAALISDLADQGDDWIDDALRDPALVKEMVLRHHRVLQGVVGQYTVLPLRFGAVFASDDSMQAALEAHREALSEALERIEGAYEWGIKIFGDPAILRRRLDEASPSLRAARHEIAAASEGRAFFLRRKLDERAEEEVEQAIGRCVDDSLQLLLSTARAAVTLKTQPRAAHGRAEEMVWNGAYLVAKESEERFFERVGALKQANGPSGFDYECTGPWPPSSFSECRMGASDEP